MTTWTPQQVELAGQLLAKNASNKLILSLLGRTRQACRDKFRHIKAISGEFTPRVVIPDDVLDDRNRRLLAPRSLTASLMGDPPLEFSALYRKEGGAA